jgi:hypothetical protein
METTFPDQKNPLKIFLVDDEPFCLASIKVLIA